MKLRFQDFLGSPSLPRSFDLVIVGSGLAGTEIASRFLKPHLRVCLVESGSDTIDERYLDLNSVISPGKPLRERDPRGRYQRSVPSHLRGLSRVRVVGGTSSIWTGKHARIPMDDLPAPNRTLRGWPIGYQTLAPYYSQVEADYLQASLAISELPEEIREKSRAAEEAGLHLGSVFWAKTPLRAGPITDRLSAAHSNFLFVTEATVVSLNLEKDGSSIAGVRVADLEGLSLTLRARFVVLAAGTLENTRLLLSEASQSPLSPLGVSTTLGRYYHDHLKHQTAMLRPGPDLPRWSEVLTRHPRPRHGVFFQLPKSIRAIKKINQSMLFLRPMLSSELPWPRRVRQEAPSYQIKLAIEQEPNMNSRLSLDKRADSLGVRRLVVDWKVSEADQDTLSVSRRIFDSGLKRLGIGQLPRTIFRIGPGDMTDSSHPMGTCRMAHNQTEGVVDSDCQVFGVRGLYVAGAAIFPSGPTYSPTLTIIALARRLADRLGEAQRNERS